MTTLPNIDYFTLLEKLKLVGHFVGNEQVHGSVEDIVIEDITYSLCDYINENTNNLQNIKLECGDKLHPILLNELKAIVKEYVFSNNIDPIHIRLYNIKDRSILITNLTFWLSLIKDKYVFISYNIEKKSEDIVVKITKQL